MSAKDLENQHSDLIPILPLKGINIFPGMVIPLFVGREHSVNALIAAMQQQKVFFLTAQKDSELETPGIDDVYNFGTLATILQLLKLPDGTIKLLVEGVERARAEEIVKLEIDGGYLAAKIVEEPSYNLKAPDNVNLVQAVLDLFEKYLKLNTKVPVEILNSVSGIDDPGKIADTIIAHVPLKLADKQSILEITDITKRLEKLAELFDSAIDILEMERKIKRRVKDSMEESQHVYYLNEQKRIINEELNKLGASNEDHEEDNEIAELAKKIETANMPKEAREKADAELKKLKMMPAMSSEATVSRNYIDCMLQVPWDKYKELKEDLNNAQDILEEEHYGLEKVKERILEYLAVHQRVKKQKGAVLCLVGPPGVGKTSLARSIARATNRDFVRFSLGGVRDEAEIRGHRKTYIGAMPGKILQKISKCGTKNPLFLLDEIDKMAMDFRGDPASALLEVLDPEQNTAFNDHYLDVDYDLSEVMFVATSNSFDIPEPLLDRMEIITIAGYTEDEKFRIAEKYLVPKQIKSNGLKDKEIVIKPEVITEIIRHYTREAGVRGLDREISKICRKVVKEILTSKKRKVTVSKTNLEKYLGVKQFMYDTVDKKDQVGQVNGLAWTEVGGELLTIEAVATSGKGNFSSTGQLGDVMKESIQAAATVIRSRAAKLGIDEEFHEKQDIHIHVPEGATPKDGPSAGIAMCTALASVLSGVPIKHDVAMTGEITLRGEVLAIGGLKEKLLAARRAGVKTVLIPKENGKDLKEIPENVIKDLNICQVKWIDEVFAIALNLNAIKKKTKKARKTIKS